MSHCKMYNQNAFKKAVFMPYGGGFSAFLRWFSGVAMDVLATLRFLKVGSIHHSNICILIGAFRRAFKQGIAKLDL